MNNLSFKNRIAFNYIITTALLIGIVFVTIFVVVKISVSGHLDEDLQREVVRHSKEIEVKNGMIALKRHKEWMEHEHNTVGVDPVFIEFLDLEGNLIDKSPNLKDSHLLYEPKQKDHVFYNGELAEKRIRQVQVPIFDNERKRVGHLLVAVSREGTEVVLYTLKNILLLTYPFILIILFLVARLIAGRSIKPINDIISTSNKITRDNLISRIPLPHNKDELYTLSDTINQLLDRVENAVEREKSFTSYASHEFRTPLSVLKGTLEVLIRKPRQQEEYETKIRYCLNEIDRLNHLVDELLILSRYENFRQSLNMESVCIQPIIEESLNHFSENIQQKNIRINTTVLPQEIQINTDIYLFSTIFNNILSNAIKYSHQNGTIGITVRREKERLLCEISDNGKGIPEEDMGKIFDKFYRSTDHFEVKGFGLGLSIVKRFCSLLNIRLEIKSEKGAGTVVRLEMQQS